MDLSEAKAIVEANLQRLMRAVGVPHWRITVYYEAASNENWAASCNRDGGDYWIASITIDPAKHDTAEDVLDSLVHELLHVVLAPFDLYRNVVTKSIEADSPADHAESVMWTHAVEQVVTMLERGLAAELRTLPEPDEEPEAE